MSTPTYFIDLSQCNISGLVKSLNVIRKVVPQIRPIEASGVNTGCLLETDLKYGLIAWAKKRPISKDKCPFLN